MTDNNVRSACATHTEHSGVPPDMRRYALLLALLVSPRLLHAQAHPLVGDWDVSYAGGMRIENDERIPIMVKGSLSILAEGDSLVAVLTTAAQEGLPARPPARFAAKRVDGKVTFLYRSEATLTLNGEQSKRTAISTYQMEATGDTLTGTVVRQVEGLDFPAEPQPVTGTRRSR